MAGETAEPVQALRKEKRKIPIAEKQLGFLFFVNKYNRRLMEDKLVTLAILTYAKAQILKNVLENEGIETYIHNVNQIQPVGSSGVRVRIKESDLPHALKITESSAWLSKK